MHAHDYDFFSVDTSGMTVEGLSEAEHSCEENTGAANKANAKAEHPPVSGNGSPSPYLRSVSGADISRALFFDFETGPDLSRLHLFNLPEVPDPPERTPVESCPDPGDFLDKNKSVPDLKAALIALCPSDGWMQKLAAVEAARVKSRKTAIEGIAAISKQLESADNAQGSRLKLLCTTPRYARITAFGYAVGDGEPQGRIATSDEQPAGDVPEDEILEEFWSLVDSCSPLVGFYNASFDIPLAFYRSAVLGVRPTKKLNLSRYNTSDVLDLCEQLGGFGEKTGKLKDLARELGIPVPAEGVDGSHAWQLYQEDPERLREYQLSDVVVTRELFWKFSGMWWV